MKTIDDYFRIDKVYHRKYALIKNAKLVLEGAKQCDIVDTIGEESIEIEGKCYLLSQFDDDTRHALLVLKDNIYRCEKEISAFYLE